MSGVLNDCDALLQGAGVRILNPKNAFINLTPSAPGFHMTGAGVVDLAVVTVTADLIALDGNVVFTAQGATLSNATARTVDVTYVNGTAIVTATVTTNGETFARSLVIPVMRDGAAGTPAYTWIKYADTAAGVGLSDDPAGKAYIGLAHNKVTATESTTPSDYVWSLLKGGDGQPGAKGADGITYYTWIKYADQADGTGLYDAPNANTLYIGIATNKTTATESTTKTDYIWSRFKGEQGVAGAPTYTWIKYADNAAGAGLTDDPSGKAYIGLAYNKASATESTTAADYTWSLIKGTDGQPGGNGADGVTLYTWIKYSDAADGTGLYDLPTVSTLYIGIATNKSTATESTVKTDYVWSKFKGDQGVQGPTTYTWVKYADTAAGTGLSDDPTGKAYIGLAYNKSIATESTTATDYAWSLIKGADGQPGGKGADGQTLYTWIKYSDVADGTGLYDLPTGSTQYLGIAVNKSTATESTIKTDYVWSKFRGADGVGTAGARGAGHYYATGSAWSGDVAQAACPNSSPVVNDVVTISTTTFVSEKRWTGSAWLDNGTVVDGKLIVSGSVLTAALAANAITADKLAADAVTARSIKVTGGGGAINRDPFFTDFPAAWVVGGTTYAATGTGNGAPANTYIRADGGTYGTAWTELMPVDPGKTYNASVSVDTTIGNNRAYQVMVNFYDQAGAWISGTTTGWGDSSNCSGFVQSGTPTPGWSLKRSGGFGAKVGGKAIPSNARSCRLGIALNWAGSSNTIMSATGLRLDLMTESTTIEPGSIETKHLKLSEGGDVSSGQTGFDQGDGFWIEGAGNGHGARMSMGNSAARKFICDPQNGILKLVNPDLQLATRVATITSNPGDSYAHTRIAGQKYCGSHTAGISNPASPSYAWSITSGYVQAQFSLSSTTAAQTIVYVTPNGAAAGDEVQCTITCTISDGGATIVISKIIYVTFQ